MSNADFTYLNALEDVWCTGQKKKDRTGTGTLSIFGSQYTYRLDRDFPILESKTVFWKGVVAELLWFLSGDTNAGTLQDQGVHIWDKWADDMGELGPVYGKQWRDFGGVDQVTNVIEQLKTDPDSRRIIVSAWNPEELPDMALAPCHTFFQFYSVEATLQQKFDWICYQDKKYYNDVYNKLIRQGTSEHLAKSMAIDHFQAETGTIVPLRTLSCQLYQRSADMFLGVPFNIASYALLTHMVAQQVNMIPFKFVHTLGDAHIYLNHQDQVIEQLNRKDYVRERQYQGNLPKLRILNKPKSIFDYTLDDFELVDYHPMGKIKAEVAV